LYFFKFHLSFVLSYAELFGVIKDNILAEYGDLGPAKTVIADGEGAFSEKHQNRPFLNS
jgi:hypothetical protein